MNIFLLSLLLFFLKTLSASETQVIEHFMISLNDGTQLAARMWLPKNSLEDPVPAILNYLPYRKRDGTRARDDPMMSWYASKGYAVLRVDMRGSGESDGHLADEYLEIEQDDAVEVIAWISRQPWCSGSVGIMGKSWGGFNALQIAAKQPPALKAILTVCSTDDRYSDDIHYMGGCLLNDNLWWGAIMIAFQARPPTSELRSDWREQWQQRIEDMPFWPAIWMKHPHRDAYWKQGSVCEKWNSIQCPVFAVGGWADAYTNAIPRMLEHLEVPRLGLIGPWAHVYAQDGLPGPAIGFMQETLRWWDQWLKGKDTSIMQEPMLRAYLEEWSSPSGWCNPAPGHWVSEETWPSKNINKIKWFFGEKILAKEKLDDVLLSICSPQWTGICAGEWMGSGVPGEMPTDQCFDDGCSLTFDTPAFEENTQLLGAPELVLNISSDQTLAHLCARLCDIAPDGTSRRISYQVLNLTHRDSHEFPTPLEIGKMYQIRIKLNDCGYIVPKKHRLRIALSTTYWPLLWPAPFPATLSIQTSKSYLFLPIRDPRIEDTFVSFEPPISGVVAPTTLMQPGKFKRYFSVDLMANIASYITDAENGMVGEGVFQLDEIGMTLNHGLKRELSIQKEDPLSAVYILTQSYMMSREEWNTRIETKFNMTSTATHFNILGELDVYENDKPFAHRLFNESIKRDL